MSAGQPWQAIPGPVDRVSFFEEQARHRRAAWWVAALCALSIVITAIPYSAIVGPLFYGLAALSLRLSSLLIPLPDTVWIPFRVAWHMLNHLVDSLDRLGPGDAFGVAGTILVLLSPGILGIVGTWLWLRMILASDGVGGVLLQLGARPPNTGDLEEQQLVNVVEEMAVAAGLKPPTVLLLDAPVANAAAVGTGPHDAKVVVSRRLLDELNRDETQGVLGHLIGSIGNGDLRVATLILSVFQTLGLLSTVLDLPISASARASMFRFVKALVLGRGEGGQSPAAIAATLLAESTADPRMNEINNVLEAPNATGLNPIHRVLLQVRRLVLIPFLLLSLFGKMVLWVVGSVLMGQSIAWAWRTRRYLADATAVQLTRNPDGLGRALESLAQRGGLIPGGQWAAHLFIVGAELAEHRSAQRRMERFSALREQMRSKPATEQLQAAFQTARELPQEEAAARDAAASGTFGESTLGMGSMHPSLNKRLHRLQAQGARISSEPGLDAGPASPLGNPLAVLIIAPLLLLCAALMSVAIGLMTMLAFLAFEIGMMVVLMLLVPGIN